MRISASRPQNKNDYAQLRLYRHAQKQTSVPKVCQGCVHNSPFSGFFRADEMKNQGFIDTILAKIINNFQVTVRNIHVRYEDSLSCPGVSLVGYNGFLVFTHLDY